MVIVLSFLGRNLKPVNSTWLGHFFGFHTKSLINLKMVGSAFGMGGIDPIAPSGYVPALIISHMK